MLASSEIGFHSRARILGVAAAGNNMVSFRKNVLLWHSQKTMEFLWLPMIAVRQTLVVQPSSHEPLPRAGVTLKQLLDDLIGLGKLPDVGSMRHTHKPIFTVALRRVKFLAGAPLVRVWCAKAGGSWRWRSGSFV
jgi:hypothetical protein